MKTKATHLRLIAGRPVGLPIEHRTVAPNFWPLMAQAAKVLFVGLAFFAGVCALCLFFFNLALRAS